MRSILASLLLIFFASGYLFAASEFDFPEDQRIMVPDLDKSIETIMWFVRATVLFFTFYFCLESSRAFNRVQMIRGATLFLKAAIVGSSLFIAKAFKL